MPRSETPASPRAEMSSVLIVHSTHSKSVRYDAPAGASDACMRSAYVSKAVIALLDNPERVRITVERA